jgi:hypothetical protein
MRAMSILAVAAGAPHDLAGKAGGLFPEYLN